MPRPIRSRQPLPRLLEIMARLRAPDGCPWDLEQDHQTLRFHAIEEVYELIDAIESRDDHLIVEELGDLLLQIVFHCQLGRERGAFDFDTVCRCLADKLIRRHPHVFGDSQARTAAAVWAQWDRIKQDEKAGTRHARASALDGVPRHLPALMRAEKVLKKARKAGLAAEADSGSRTSGRVGLGRRIFELVAEARAHGWSAEDLLRAETNRREKQWRRDEKRRGGRTRPRAR